MRARSQNYADEIKEALLFSRACSFCDRVHRLFLLAVLQVGIGNTEGGFRAETTLRRLVPTRGQTMGTISASWHADARRGTNLLRTIRKFFKRITKQIVGNGGRIKKTLELRAR